MFYKITLTASDGLDPHQIEEIGKYLSLECQHAYVINEFGENKENSHLEGVIEFDTKTTSNVTDRIVRLYGTLNIDVTPHITIKVKRATHLVGALIYASKELRDTAQVIVLKGWEQSWIDQQIKNNVHDIPHSMLKKKGHRVTQGTGPALIYEWCLAHNMQVIRKCEYLEIIDRMGDEGFLFGKCRHLGLFQDVCCLFHVGRSARNVAESELRWVD